MVQARSIAQVVERLNALQGDDKEWDHNEADLLLLDALLLVDLDSVVTAFQEARDRIGFWYA